MCGTQVSILKEKTNKTLSAVAALDYLGVISFSSAFELMVPGQYSGKWRARGVTITNRDGSVIHQQQGNKKRRLSKDSSEMPCDQIFNIYTSLIHIISFFPEYTNTSTFPFSPIHFRQTKLYKCNRLSEG